LSGSYAVGTNSVNFAVGGTGAAGTGAYTIAALVQPASGNNNAGFIGLYATATLTRALFEDSLLLFGNNDFSSGFGPGGGNMTQDTWYIVVESKAAGSNTYRFHIWAYDAGGAGSFSHGVSTGAANQGDGSTITQIRLGANAVSSNGLIAVGAVWNRVLSDAEVDSMKSANLATWKNVSGGAPTALISLENWNGSTGGTDLVGTSTQSSVTGTVSTGANPPSFNFSIGGTDATVSASVVAAIAAVPAPTVKTGSTVTGAVVAAVAAVPAPTVKTGSTVNTATVAAVAAVPAPTVSAGSSLTTATVAAVAAVGAPTVTISSIITAVTVAAVAAVPAPTVKTGSTVTAAVVAAVAAVPAPSLSTGSVVSAVTVAAVAAVPAPSVSAGGNATVNASTVAVFAAVGAAIVSAGSTVTAAMVAAVAAMPTPTAGAGSTASPATVGAVAAIGSVTVTTTGGTTVVTVTVMATARVGAVTVTVAATRRVPLLVHIREAPTAHIREAPLVHVSD